MIDLYVSKGWRAALRISRAILYLCVIGFGLSGILLTPVTVSDVVGNALLEWWSFLAIIGGSISFIGNISGKYRVEWSGILPALGGTMMYAITIWGFVIMEYGTRSSQAFVATGLCAALAYRWLEVAARSSMARSQSRKKRAAK